MSARPLLVLLLAAVLSGCADGDPVAVPSPPSPPRVSASPSAPVGPAVDLRAPTATRLSARFGLQACEGDAPLVCVTEEGVVAGQLELLAFPLDSLPELRGRTGRALLDAHAAAYVRSFREDRAQGCPAGYRVTPLEVRHLDTADGPVVTYGFVGVGADGRPSELQVQWAGVRGDALVVLSAPAYEADGCLPPEGTALPVAALEELQPLLDAVVRASRLGPAAAP